MDEEPLAERFGEELDKQRSGRAAEKPDDPELAKDLDLASRLSSSDLSRESGVRRELRAKLVARGPRDEESREESQGAWWAGAGRRELAFISLLAVVGLGAGAGFRAWVASRTATGAAGSSQARSTLFRPGFSRDAAAMWARLTDALRPKGGRPFTIERLAGLLRGRKDVPAAQAFAADFERDPALMAIWDEYAQSQDTLDASWLARRLSNSQAFSDLLNRHMKDPSFAALGESLTSEVAAATAPGESSVASASAVSHQDRIAAYSPVESGAAPDGARPAPRRSASPERASSVPAADIAANDSAPRAEDETSIVRREAGEGAHGVGKLKTLRIAGPSRASNAWASLCYTGDPAISRDECAAINGYLGQYALWDACFNASLVDKCVSLCSTKPELGCAGQASAMLECKKQWPAWKCARACSERPDCRISESPDVGSGGSVEGDGGEGRGPRCPGPNCDQCGSNPGMPGCADFCAQHPGDCNSDKDKDKDSEKDKDDGKDGG